MLPAPRRPAAPRSRPGGESSLYRGGSRYYFGRTRKSYLLGKLQHDIESGFPIPLAATVEPILPDGPGLQAPFRVPELQPRPEGVGYLKLLPGPHPMDARSQQSQARPRIGRG